MQKQLRRHDAEESDVRSVPAESLLMKIALVKRRYSLRHGGSERYCVNLSRTLTRMGHEVTVIGESIDADLVGEVRFIPVRVLRLSSSTRNRTFAENAGAAARAGGYDVAYGLGRSYGLDAVRVTERLQAHWLNVYYRSGISRFVQRNNPRHRTLIGLERDIYCAASTRRIITQSQLDRLLVQEYYGVPAGKIHTVYNGVDARLFHPGLREHAGTVRRELGIASDVPLLVFASMDFEGKGLRYILRALAGLRQQDATLAVLGKGPEAKFRRIAARLGIENRILFAGRRNDIERYYAAADLCVLPTAYEPFPNVNLEAMACGTPVVTTSTSGAADMVEHQRSGYLVSAVDAVEEIGTAIETCLNLSTAERAAMAARCREIACSMTIEKNVEQTVKILEEVRREKLSVRAA